MADSPLLPNAPTVDIVAGKNRYVLIEIKDPGSDRKRIVVRGVLSESHKDAAEPILRQILTARLDYLNVEQAA